MTRMSANYPGTCALCGGRIARGSEIDWDRASRQARHWSCGAAASATPTTESAPAPAMQPIVEPIHARYPGIGLVDAGCGLLHLDRRVDAETWDAIKAHFAYHDADRAEDNDDFALAEVRSGWYTDESGVAAVEATLGIAPEDGYVARRARAEIAAAEARAAEAERAAREQAERDHLGAAYADWKAEHLTDLVCVSAEPELDAAGWQSGPSWPKGTPGTWYDTGDWYRVGTTPRGATVYTWHYGNARQYYLPASEVDAAYDHQWQAHVAAYLARIPQSTPADAEMSMVIELLRSVSERPDLGCLGDDLYRHLIARHSVEHYSERARAYAAEHVIYVDAAEHAWRDQQHWWERFEVPVVALRQMPYDYATCQRYTFAGVDPKSVQAHPQYLYETPDGRVVGRAYAGHFGEVVETATAAHR